MEETEAVVNEPKEEGFGEVLFMNGNQKTCLISARELCGKNIRIYGNQRLNETQVKELVMFQKEKFLKCGQFIFRGSILLCKDPSEKIFWLIDGQHTFEVVKSLLTENDIQDFNIRVDIINVATNDEIKEEFQDINKSIPVPPHYFTQTC